MKPKALRGVLQWIDVEKPLYTWAWRNENGYEWATDVEPIRPRESVFSPDYGGVTSFPVDRQIPSEEQSGPWLVPLGPEKCEIYDAASVVAIHRRFGDRLEPTPGAVLRFACTYGGLGRCVLCRTRHGKYVQAESFPWWRAQVLKVRFLLKALDLARDGKLPARRELARLLDPASVVPGAVRLQFPLECALAVTFPVSLAPWFQSTVTTEGEMQDNSRSYVGISAKVIAAVHEYVNEELSRGFGIATVPGRHYFYAYARNLLGTIYKSFADELIELPPGFKVCPICQAFFTEKRSDAIYCSRECRQRHHYRKGGSRINGKPKTT